MRRCVAEVVPWREVVGDMLVFHLPRKSLVVEFLLAPAIDFLLVIVGLWEVAPAVGEVGIVGLFVEPHTDTSFPWGAAREAELGSAPTCHVVAAFGLFHCGFAVVAVLPAFFFRDSNEFLGRGVLGTFASGVPLVVAEAAYFGLTALAFTIFAAVIGSTIGVGVDV